MLYITILQSCPSWVKYSYTLVGFSFTVMILCNVNFFSDNEVPMTPDFSRHTISDFSRRTIKSRNSKVTSRKSKRGIFMRVVIV